jgi:acyl-CoA thioesterase-1
MKHMLRHLALVLAAVLCASAAAAEPVRIVAFGDSLTAGYGLPPGAGFPARLEAALKAKGLDVVVADAGASGDTSTAALARLDWSVPQETDAVIVEIGANDALRGIAPELTRDNLDAIVGRLRARGLPVLVAGMRAPPNMGEAYVTAFDAIYPDVAAKHGALLYPFFLDGVAAERSLNLADGMHPTAAGIDVIVGRILPTVEALVAEAKAKPS